MRRFLIWFNNDTVSPKIDTTDRQSEVENRDPANKFAHARSSQEIAKHLNEVIRKQSGSKECEEIFSNEKLFRLLKPMHWITAAKEKPILFRMILEHPALASWVNQFPLDDQQGLVMIATYSNEHLVVARDFLPSKSSDSLIFSTQQIAQIKNAIAVKQLSETLSDSNNASYRLYN